MENGSEGGDDRLVSGANTEDRMWGDFRDSDGAAIGGTDTFVFGRDNGTDVIYDFREGEDTIELDGLASLPSRNARWSTYPIKCSFAFWSTSRAPQLRRWGQIVSFTSMTATASRSNMSRG
jgi:hypothetical protein